MMSRPARATLQEFHLHSDLVNSTSSYYVNSMSSEPEFYFEISVV